MSNVPSKRPTIQQVAYHLNVMNPKCPMMGSGFQRIKESVFIRLYIESEVHDVAVFHYIILSLYTEFPGLTYGSLGSVL